MTINSLVLKPLGVLPRLASKELVAVTDGYRVRFKQSWLDLVCATCATAA